MSKEKILKLFAFPYVLLVLNSLSLLLVCVLILFNKTLIAICILALTNIIFGIAVLSTRHMQVMKAKTKVFDAIFLLGLGFLVLLFAGLVFLIPDFPIL